MEPEIKKPRLESDNNGKDRVEEITHEQMDRSTEGVGEASDPSGEVINTALSHDEPANIAEEGNVMATGDLKFLKEEDVGILCYISDLPGCHGVIKQRLEVRYLTLVKLKVEEYYMYINN